MDDGSTDHTSVILDKYSQKDARIKVFHTSNHGVSAVRNLGIDLSSGKKIFFFDGDDYFDKDILRKTLEVSYKTGCETVIYGYGNDTKKWFRQFVKKWMILTHIYHPEGITYSISVTTKVAVVTNKERHD